jgi:hypothetical protein
MQSGALGAWPQCSFDRNVRDDINEDELVQLKKCCPEDSSSRNEWVRRNVVITCASARPHPNYQSEVLDEM